MDVSGNQAVLKLTLTLPSANFMLLIVFKTLLWSLKNSLPACFSVFGTS